MQRSSLCHFDRHKFIQKKKNICCVDTFVAVCARRPAAQISFFVVAAVALRPTEYNFCVFLSTSDDTMAQ